MSTACPRCESRNVVPIIYGKPGCELVEESAAGRVALGGCVVFREAPTVSARSAATIGARMHPTRDCGTAPVQLRRHFYGLFTSP